MRCADLAAPNTVFIIFEVPALTTACAKRSTESRARTSLLTALAEAAPSSICDRQTRRQWRRGREGETHGTVANGSPSALVGVGLMGFYPRAIATRRIPDKHFVSQRRVPAIFEAESVPGREEKRKWEIMGEFDSGRLTSRVSELS